MNEAPDPLVVVEDWIDDYRVWVCRFQHDPPWGTSVFVTQYGPEGWMLNIGYADDIRDLSDPFVRDFRQRVIDIALATGVVKSIGEEGRNSWWFKIKHGFEPTLLIDPMVKGLFFGEAGARLKQWEADLPSTPIVRGPVELEPVFRMQTTFHHVPSSADLKTLERRKDPQARGSLVRAIRALGGVGLDEASKLIAAARARESPTAPVVHLSQSRATEYLGWLNELGGAAEIQTLGPVQPRMS